MSAAYPETPDGRYFVAKGRLWRRSDPRLAPDERQRLVEVLMSARRAVGRANDDADLRRARADVESAKRALGERGPVWWDDGADDQTRRAPWNSTYAAWWESLSDDVRARADPPARGKTLSRRPERRNRP